MVAADHPERAIVAQRPPRRAQPGAGEVVVGFEAVELVPIVVDPATRVWLGRSEFVRELQIVWRIGENHVDAAFGQLGHELDAIADLDDVDFHPGAPATSL